MDKQELYSKAFDLSLHMLIELPYDEIINAAKAVGGYNEFNAEDLQKMMEMFDEIIPRQYYNEGNPNNGRRLYTLSLGREGSMVLYYKLHSYGHGKDKEAIETILSHKQRLQTIAEGIGKADEFDITQSKEFMGEELEIRIWWD